MLSDRSQTKKDINNMVPLKAILGKKAEWWFLRAETREGVFYLRIRWEVWGDRNALYPDGDNVHISVELYTKKSN